MSRTAYLDWLQRLGGSNGSEQYLRAEQEREPIFVTSDLEPQAFFSKVDSDEGLTYVAMERDLVMALDDESVSPRVEALLFRKPGYEVPSELFASAGVKASVQVKPEPKERKGTAVAIIDDGIGFLNARFRSDQVTSRFLAVWLQSAPSPLLSASGPQVLQMGRLLYTEDIARLMSRLKHTPETTLYREVHDGLHADPRLVKTIFQAATHGTHVLDLAAGADPLDPTDAMREIPLIAVQLPPAAVDDTSGTGMEIPLIQGLRWSIWVALKSSLSRLVVNVSLGVLAGAKDGNSFLERRMAREIDRAAKAGLTVDIVLPYGNDYRHRQVARLSAEAGARAEIVVRLQPQDGTPSYIEIRDLNAVKSSGGKLVRIGLVMPDGTPVEPVALACGTQRDILWRGRLVARIYHLEEIGRQPDKVFILALAPTVALVPEGLAAPAGAWRIVFEDLVDQDIVLQVQRDDRAAGYRLLGRQAYFDAGDAYQWDRNARDWTGLETAAGPASALRHEGTNSAYATSRHPSIHSVGGAMVPHGGAPQPARYASKGAPWSGGRPRLSAECEIAHSQPGLTASGTLSGSTARFSGSSAAAPTHTRVLALQGRQSAVRTIYRADDKNVERLGEFVHFDNPAARHR